MNRPGCCPVTVDGSCTAGSSVAINCAIAVFMQCAKVTLGDGLQAATDNTARFFRQGEICARPVKREPANLVRFRSGEQALEIETVVCRGQRLCHRDDRSTVW